MKFTCLLKNDKKILYFVFCCLGDNTPHLCNTCVSPASCVSPVSHLYITCVSPISHPCLTRISPVFQECPKCHSTIEKDGGCNHMVCKKCRFDFCWVCLGPWEPHGSSWSVLSLPDTLSLSSLLSPSLLG